VGEKTPLVPNTEGCFIVEIGKLMLAGSTL